MANAQQKPLPGQGYLGVDPMAERLCRVEEWLRKGGTRGANTPASTAAVDQMIREVRSLREESAAAQKRRDAQHQQLDSKIAALEKLASQQPAPGAAADDGWERKMRFFTYQLTNAKEDSEFQHPTAAKKIKLCVTEMDGYFDVLEKGLKTLADTMESLHNTRNEITTHCNAASHLAKLTRRAAKYVNTLDSGVEAGFDYSNANHWNTLLPKVAAEDEAAEKDAAADTNPKDKNPKDKTPINKTPNKKA